MIGDIIKVSVKEAIPRGKVKKGDVIKRGSCAYQQKAFVVTDGSTDPFR